MAEIARANNGKFVSRAAQAANGTIGSITGDVSESPGADPIGPQTTVNPAEIERNAAGRGTGSDESDAGTGKRGRGRPAGSGNKKEEQKRPETSGKLDLDSLNFTLFYAHSLLAKATKTPELELDKTEAETLAKSAMNVMQHYNIKASQKAIDWGNLLLTMVIIYGGKFHAVHARQEASKKAKREDSNAGLQPFNLGAG